MPGDRRQILSLLRLPIPPLQPSSFLSVNGSNCNARAAEGAVDIAAVLFYQLTAPIAIVLRDFQPPDNSG
jgi:hypothetical protein